MNKQLIIEAFEAAKKEGIPHGRGVYRRPETGEFCPLGVLAKYMGFSEKEILPHSIGKDDFESMRRMEKYYGMAHMFQIAKANDSGWASWDDAITWTEDYPDET